MNLLETFFEHVTQKSRDILLDTEQGQMIYSDKDQHYAPVKPEFIRNVSCVDSFAQYVIKEAKRRNYSSGEEMTALFDMKGGIAYLDEDKQRDMIIYKRSLSQQFEELSNFCDGSSYNHNQLLRGLQRLRYSIVNYEEFMRHYRAVKFTGSNVVKSQPIINEGQAGTSVDFMLQVQNGTEENKSLPTEFGVSFSFARGEDDAYSSTITIEMYLDDGEPRFRPLFHEREEVIEDALKEEVETFKSDLLKAGLKETLVALNY